MIRKRSGMVKLPTAANGMEDGVYLLLLNFSLAVLFRWHKTDGILWQRSHFLAPTGRV